MLIFQSLIVDKVLKEVKLLLFLQDLLTTLDCKDALRVFKIGIYLSNLLI